MHWNFKNRVGEMFVTNDKESVEIIEYIGTFNCTIRYKDGTIKKGVTYNSLVKGTVKKPVNRLGESHLNSIGLSMKIIKYTSSMDVSVIFENGFVVNKTTYNHVLKGTIKNLLHPCVHGVGYVGIGKYNPRKHFLYYNKWASMLQRCYSKLCQEKHQTYKGCSVAIEWHNFQNFAKWSEEKYNYKIMEGWHLDKDILFKGNKIYSPETCCIIPNDINIIFSGKGSSRDGLPTGVVRNKNKKRFMSVINEKHLGTFNTVEESFNAYKIVKEDRIKDVANKWRGKITEECYWVMINYQVQITD